MIFTIVFQFKPIFRPMNIILLIFYNSNHYFFYKYFFNLSSFSFQTPKNRTHMLQRNLRSIELGQKLHKNNVRQITCPKQIVSKPNSKTIEQQSNRSLINGIVNIQNVLSFLKNAKVNESLQNSIIVLLNSYTQNLETFIHTNLITHSTKIEKKSSLSYLSVKIVPNQEKKKIKQLDKFDQQISQHRKNTQIENQNQKSLLSGKQTGINKLSNQNLKKINQSKGFLPQIKKKIASNNSQVIFSVRKQNQKEIQNLIQKSKQDFEGLLQKKHTNLHEQKILQVQLQQKVKIQVSKSGRQGQLGENNKHQLDQNLKDHIYKTDNECKVVDSAQIITKLKDKISNCLILIEELKAKLTKFQEHQTQIHVDKNQKMKIHKSQAEINTQFEINQQKYQSFDDKNSMINQRNEEISILKQQLQQKQSQLTNLWIVIQESNYHSFNSQV